MHFLLIHLFPNSLYAYEGSGVYIIVFQQRQVHADTGLTALASN